MDIFPANTHIWSVYMCFKKPILMNAFQSMHQSTSHMMTSCVCAKGGSQQGYTICMSWVLEKLLLALAESKNGEGGRMGEEEEDSKTTEEAIDFAFVKLTGRGVCSAG